MLSDEGRDAGTCTPLRAWADGVRRDAAGR